MAARESKLERLTIPDASRTVKDWFPTRESVDAVIPAIRAHIKATGETHTCFCHTHTKPDRNAVPVYVADFEIPERARKAKRFCPCPCCWAEFGKFGHGKIAWFPEERVIRLIGPDCFAALNPEAHAKAQSDFEIEQERKRNTDFLLSNLPHLTDVIRVVERAEGVAKAIEVFHEGLQAKLSIVKLNLWSYVRHNGELNIVVKENEFRRGEGNEMYSTEVDVEKVFAVLAGYRMLAPDLPPLSVSLKNSLDRIRPHQVSGDVSSYTEQMDDAKRRAVAETLSRSVAKAREKIAEIEMLRAFIQPVTINTLRNWGQQEGCPITLFCSHEGDRIAFGKQEHQAIFVELPASIRHQIGEIEFWIARERTRR